MTIKPDADGHAGRECPTCERHFNSKFGTDLRGGPNRL